MALKKGLGRGLDILIPKEETVIKKEEKKEEGTKKEIENYDLEVDIRKVEPNRNQPRKQFDEDAIEELSESIKQFGVIQPLIVKKKDDFYEIIAGERRWRASKKAGLKTVPVIVKEYDEKEILKISLIENLQRENLNPIEEAKAYQQLQQEYNLKQDEIAMSVSKSRTAITNTMRLLKLDERVQKMIIDNRITSGHGRTLISIEDRELQCEIAEKIMDEGLSVREAERLVKRLSEKKEDPEKEEENSEENNMMLFYEGRMKQILGSKVSIKKKKNDKGRIEIEYYSKEELERIIDLIQSIREKTE
ncbi:MAG: ParB/RepB/Spo0J family partition protein [Eubacteriales bacterium]|nr:ParB/RepB/Spo0J family partition protein [Eubacteriales bacterium]